MSDTTFRVAVASICSVYAYALFEKHRAKREFWKTFDASLRDQQIQCYRDRSSPRDLESLEACARAKAVVDNLLKQSKSQH